jgi:hypothetical protein
MSDSSPRRIALGVALTLLLWADVSTIYKALALIGLGNDFGALGMPNIGAGLAAITIPVVALLLWLTYRVWQALRES